MTAFLALLKDKFRGAGAYLKEYSHLTDEEISRLKEIILVPKIKIDSAATK